MKLTIRIISILGAIITSILVYKDIFLIETCPLFLIFPACYLILISFLSIIISTFELKFKRNFLLFTVGAIIGEVNAVWFSINQIMGNDYCPMFYDIPLCYVSLITFSSLIIFKYLEFTSSKNSIYKYR